MKEKEMKGNDLLAHIKHTINEEDEQTVAKFLKDELITLRNKRETLKIAEDRFQSYCDMTVTELANFCYSRIGKR